ncbi:hypothetical protein, partial [Escherichia coli]|uniref:hypothetical protein n=1 Tax=Escherichia coli TaxID=562 RepID=UPI001A955376
DDKGWDARKRAYCLKIQPATGSFARNLIYSTKPLTGRIERWPVRIQYVFSINNRLCRHSGNNRISDFSKLHL